MNNVIQMKKNKKNIISKLLSLVGYKQKNNKKNILINKLGGNYSNWYQYLSYKNPINLLFSCDQFMYEFLLKYPQRTKASDYKIQLKEQKKLCIFYGSLSKKQLYNYYLKGANSPGDFSKNLISILESRLDVVIYRSGFAKNIISARQLITHKKVLVNNQILSIPSHLLNPGDIIAIHPKSRTGIRKVFLGNFEKYQKKPTGTALESAITNDLFLLPINTLNSWITKNANFSKKKFEFLISLIAKKIFSRAFIKRYKNPFASLDTRMKFPYFYMCRLHQHQAISHSRKDAVEQYRKLLVEFMASQKITTLEKKIFLLQLKKYLSKPLTKNEVVKIMNFKNIKPLHLEISYKLCTSIYLYAPQRVYYPFILNFDILKRF